MATDLVVKPFPSDHKWYGGTKGTHDKVYPPRTMKAYRNVTSWQPIINCVDHLDQNIAMVKIAFDREKK